MTGTKGLRVEKPEGRAAGTASKATGHGGFMLGAGLAILVVAQLAVMISPTGYQDARFVYALLVPTGYALLMVWGTWAGLSRHSMSFHAGGAVLATLAFMLTNTLANRVVPELCGVSTTAFGVFSLVTLASVVLSVPAKMVLRKYR